MRKITEILLASLFAFQSAMMGAAEESSGGYPDVEVQLTGLEEEFLRVGRYVQAAAISRVDAGISAEEVTQMLGGPEVVERRNGAQEWYYNINLPLADGVNQLVCQYRVDVNPSLAVQGTQWRRSQCRTLFNEFVGSLQVVSFSSDVMFRFDSAELQPEGMQTLSDVALILINQYEEPDILITGHTDRIGSSEYNQRLSERRATTVRSYLESRGVPPRLMRAEGLGMQEPVTTCLGTRVDQQLKDCLAPNRRVNLRIVESSFEG